ncbi:outer membrane beta-barrel protein [uncultured Pontibacter sp.]|uniref:outer membrane beta-barrel protein n=1 Tax=uncultured Pontibacter sp. TaxID=453356 RepID=UPI00260D82D3|nr:outer membrane beta-barrel protein [uncultured Pontibacter sp.]
MKHLYLTLLAFLFFAQAFAQKDFRTGYIVQDHDTLRGYVDYRGANRNSKTATFKSTLESTEQAYTPAQLAGYGFDKENKAYESKVVPATETQPEQLLFLHALVKGKASLYNYRDDLDRDRFYFSKDNAVLVELTEHNYTSKDPKTGKTYRTVEKPYLGVLGSAFYDCASLSENRLKTVALQHSSLTKVVQTYNQCMGSTQYAKEPKKTSYKPVPMLTFSIPSLNMAGEHSYAKGSYSSTGIGLGAGVAMQVSNPAVSEKISLLFELLYAPYRFEGTVQTNYSSGRTTVHELLFDLHYLKLPVQLRYTFPKGKVRPFINVGASYSYAVYTNRQLKTTSTFHSTSYTEESEALPGSDFRPSMLGTLGGIGIMYPIKDRTLFLETRYESADGISRIIMLPSSIKTFSLMAGYSF